MVPAVCASVSMREKWAHLRSPRDPPKPTWPPHAEKAQYSKGANDICCLQGTDAGWAPLSLCTHRSTVLL